MNNRMDLTSLLALAASNGMSDDELKEIKRQFMIGSQRPTKKYLSRDKRKAKRKAQKVARRRNRHS